MKTEILLLMIGILIGAGVTEYRMCGEAKGSYSWDYGTCTKEKLK